MIYKFCSNEFGFSSSNGNKTYLFKMTFFNTHTNKYTNVYLLQPENSEPTFYTSNYNFDLEKFGNTNELIYQFIKISNSFPKFQFSEIQYFDQQSGLYFMFSKLNNFKNNVLYSYAPSSLE